MRKARLGFVGFGEVNTPKEVIERKCREALENLQTLDVEIFSTGPVSDDSGYIDADRAVSELSGHEFDVLILCIAGWIPSHAVIRVSDKFRHKPILLWGLCGYNENNRMVSTADQAGTTALRYTLQALNYKFKYVYNVIGKPMPLEKIDRFIKACRAASLLRDARIGTMGYRDMLLYGTMFDGVSLRRKIGVEVEPFEMYEIVQKLPNIDEKQIAQGIEKVRTIFRLDRECDNKILELSVKYAAAISEKIKERKLDAVSLIDVDGMKKLAKLPPALTFMLIDLMCSICTIPENDIMGSVTQLMVRYLTGQIAAYAEFYEFFEDSFLIGVPDFIPYEVTEGQPALLPSEFGLLSTSVMNVSKFKSGFITLARLIDYDGKYYMHLLTGEAKQPRAWEECGWTPPAPKLPSLEVKPDCSMDEFVNKVASQHIILAYGDHREEIRNLCYLLDIEVI